MSDTNKPINRRNFVRLGAAASTVLAMSPWLKAQANKAGNQETKNKQWARKALRGGEAFIMPSMQADLRKLDEEGLRRDVRHSIAQGFCSIMPLALSLDDKQFRHMQEVIADEANNKIFLVDVIRPGDYKQTRKTVRAMERVGVSHALMYFDPKQSSQADIEAQMRAIIENTSLGIILYAKPSPKIEKLDPTGLPMQAFSRLAELDNVIGVKFTQELRPASAYALAETLGDQLLLGVVDLEVMLLLAAKYPMQWTGQWGIDSLQSPSTPWVTQFLDLLRNGKRMEAYDLYWRYEPIASAFYQLQAPYLRIGGHPWMHIKYMKWLTGGNGGLLPELKESAEHVPVLDAPARAKCRAAFEKVAIQTVDLPDEAFVVGTAAYERGVRIKELKQMPRYAL